ncbi:hypothetical protein OJAV_G00110630 [Oryzias javanicus]|uniref:SET domain-containing protein n=1 Tax=Oryzias javanicus TaxID=123683 RepID=A0A3S2UAR3_ORYJA|nr:hypothetical protein OJAV_G00110630 [Oryzias javanicus]
MLPLHLHRKCSHKWELCFLFEFLWKGEQWCVDASKEDQTLGKLVNNDHASPNCVVKKIEFEGKPHLCLVTAEDISPGEEITYSYRPWTDPLDSEMQKFNEEMEASNSNSFSSTPRTTRRIATPVSYREMSGSDDDNDSRASSDFEFSSEFKQACLSDGDSESTEDESKEHHQTFTTQNYCYVCGKGRVKLSRHFQRHAAMEPEIAEALALPKGSSERKALLNVLRSRGNHKHNQKVLRTKRGSLKLLQCPKTKTVKTKKYMHCPYCKGMITQLDSHTHLVMCVKRELTVAAVRRTGGTLGEAPPDKWEQKVPHGVRQILSSMKHDEITVVLQNDYTLMRLAQKLVEEHGSDPGKQDSIRRRLREMGRLLFNLHKKCILNLEDAFQPKNFRKVVKVVKIMADFDVGVQAYNKPGLALKVAESLLKVGHVFLSQTKRNKEVKADVSTFMYLCEKEWLEHPPVTISPTVSSLSTIPFTEDVQRLHGNLENLCATAVESLTAHESAEAFISLSKLTLTQVMFLNQFNPKVSKLTLRSFQETKGQVFKHFVTVNVSSKSGRSVPILLTSRLVSALTLLISKRALCGVNEGNPFLFAKPNGCATGHFNGRRLSQASKPEHLTSVHFRKHSARIFQILSLENDELECLSKLLGYEIQTDCCYYQTPEAAVELAKIAKLLSVTKKGLLERVEGKSLEDVEIEDFLEPDKQQKKPERAGAKEDTNELLFLLQKIEHAQLKLRAEEDALEHIKSGRDKSFLQEKVIDSFKGKGVFTCESIEPSSFVVEYRGSIFTQEEGERDDTVENYLFNFSWNGTNWCVDASAEDGSLGRLVNDDQKSPTCELRKLVYEQKPHLCLFALKKISAGQEITFNYGNSSYPWRSKQEEAETKTNPPETDSNDSSYVPSVLLDKTEESSSSDYSSSDELVCYEESNCTEGFSRSEVSFDNEESPSLDDSDSDTKQLRLTRRNFCFVCEKPQSKISRHLKTHIAEVPEIAEVFRLRRNSKDRKKELAKLRNRGNQMHNKHVLKTRQGELRMNKKLKKSYLETFAICIYCKNMFRRPILCQHMQNCPSKVSNPPAQGNTQILADPECVSSDMKKFLEALKEDKVGRGVLRDPYLLQLAQCIFSIFNSKDRDVNTRYRIRQMGRLLLVLQEKGINCFEEALKPQNFPSLLEAVNIVAGSNKESKYYKKTKADIGKSLKKLADIRYAMSANDREAVQETEEFMKLCLKEWPAKIAVESKISGQSTIPFIQDVQVLYRFTLETVTSATETITSFAIPPVYTALLRGIVAYMSFLNGVEIGHVTLRSFQERGKADANENNALCEFEQILAKRTVKINVDNLKGKRIALVLTPDLLSATELLVEKRGVCGVHENNPHLFAKPSNSSLSAYNVGSTSNLFVSRCGAKKTESLRSAFFNKYVRTVFQILTLGNEELSQLAKLLGRDIPTQREYYQTPEASADIARILELLSAVTSGSLESFEGKSLKEISIPDELLPVNEKSSATKTSEDAAQERAAKKRSSSSKKPSKRQRKRSQNEDEQTDTQSTETCDDLEKTVAERVVDAPEETAAQSRDDGICFSDDEEDMNVDFDMNIETDGSDDEYEGNGADEADDDSDGGCPGPAIHGENVVREASEGQCEKQKDASSGDYITEEKMNEDNVKKNDPYDKDTEMYSGLSSSVSKGKKFPLMMKEVKILLPKLNPEELKALLQAPAPSRDPQLVEDQPHHDTRKQSDSRAETPSSAQTLQMTCSNCKKSMMLGHTAYQKKGFKDVFCSKQCLFEMFPSNSGTTKKCHFCLNRISKPLDLIMAVVDLKGTTKDFCSTSCLCYFKSRYLRRGMAHYSKSTISTQTPPLHCSLCNKTCSTSLEVDLDDAVHNFCSDVCLEDFCRANIGVCFSCGATCCKKPLRLKLTDTTRIFCDTKCLEVFKEKTDTYHQCLMCRNYLPLSDMLYHKNNDSTMNLLCNWHCLSSYKKKCIKEQDLKSKAGKQSEQTSKSDEGQLCSDVQDGSVSLSDKVPHPTVSPVDTICCTCFKEVNKGSSKYQINAEVFCSVPCVKEKHPYIKFAFKMCHNCFNVIKRPQNVILAPVDNSGVLVELCSNECLSAVKTKKKMAAVKPQPQRGPCSLCKMCSKYRYCKHQATIGNEVHRFCSQSCLTIYHRVNKLPYSECDVCSNICLDKGLTVTTEGSRKNICGDECLVKFKKGVLTPLTCPTCCTSHWMSDMIENKDCEAELEFFCSHRCLMVHKAQAITIIDIKSSPCSEEEVKPPLLNLNSEDAVMVSAVSPKKDGFKIKEEQIDEDYNGGLPASMFLQNVKDEPDVKKEDLKISSVFSLKEESKPAQPASEQTDSPASCSACKTVLKDGETVYQRKGHVDIFCSTSCLLKFYQNKTVKTCHFCMQTISQPEATLQVLENNETTMKDFCSQSCLSSFNYKSTVPTKHPIAGAPSHSQCSVCCRCCTSKHEVIHQEVIHKICSDPCFHRFCNINSLSVCENCHTCSKTPLMLKMEDGHKALCSSECLSQFKQKIQTPQLCSMCSTSALISDMIPHKNSDGLLELFCSKSCLMASKIQGLSASGTELNCNNCGRMRIPACHLSMSDSSIRSFCSLTCAMSFKEKHKDQNNAANSQGTSSLMEADLYGSPDKPACAQCRQTIHSSPTVIHYKEGVNFVCSPACSQEFKRINNITSLCEYCKNERLINEVKRFNNKDCCFCSEGCKILFHYELEKKWGKHCHSCTFCHSISKTVVTAHYDESEKEFCSAECSFGYTSLQSHVSACDMCSHTGRLKQSLSLLGEVKHFCDLKCLLRFCSKKVQTVHTGPLVSGSVGSGDSLPVITSIISLSNPVPIPAQLGAFPDIQTKVVGHASIQTDPMELKNKSVFCVPLVHNKGASCTVHTVEKQTQTVTLKEKVLPAKPTVLPLPVPVYVPLPMNMYSQMTPQPVALPVLLPVPVFLPEKPDGSEQNLTPAEAVKADISCRPEKEMNDKRELEDHGKEEEQRQQILSPEVASPVMLQTADDGDGGLLSVDPVSVIDHPVADPDLQLASSNTENTVDKPLSQTPPPDPGLGTSGCHPPDPPPQKRPPSPLLNVADKQEGPHNDRPSQQSSVKASSRRPPCVKSKYGVLSWRKWIHRRKSKADVDHVSSSAVTLKADILGCSSSELNESLCLFIKEMTRRNGEPYTPDRLFYLCLCIQKYLFENMRSENIFSDQTYHKFSLELTRILKQFRSTLPGSAVIRSCVEEEFLWDCKQLGVYSPITLLNTLLFFFCKYFHFTTVEQHLQLSFARLKTCTTSKDGRETAILRFTPHTPSNQEETGEGVPAKKLRLNVSEDFLEIEENLAIPAQCPVRLFKFYISKCSESTACRDDVFYLQPGQSCVPSSSVWFSSTPLDHSSIEAMIVRILSIREMQREETGRTFPNAL